MTRFNAFTTEEKDKFISRVDETVTSLISKHTIGTDEFYQDIVSFCIMISSQFRKSSFLEFSQVIILPSPTDEAKLGIYKFRNGSDQGTYYTTSESFNSIKAPEAQNAMAFLMSCLLPQYHKTDDGQIDLTTSSLDLSISSNISEITLSGTYTHSNVSIVAMFSSRKEDRSNPPGSDPLEGQEGKDKP
jgi:hypothetical protein